MNLDFGKVRTLFRTELRMVLRDRRMLVTSILLPLLVTPLLFLGSTWTLKQREKSLREMVYRYAVGGSNPEYVRTLLDATRTRLASEAESKTNRHRFQFEEVTCADPTAALAKGDIQVIVESWRAEEVQPPKSEEKGKTGKEAVADADEGEAPLAGAPVVRLVFRADRDESAAGVMRLRNALAETRRAQRADRLEARGFPVRPAEVAVITERDLASKTQVAGLALGRMLTLLLLFFIFTAGAVVATDSLAGEKERGTLETLLTTAANRVEILAAKHLVILAVALMITLIQSANLLVYIGFNLLPVPANLTAAVPAWKAGLLFLLYLPVAALAANVLLLISGYAKSYKEAQMYFLPVFLVGLLPALAPFLPGVPLRSVIVLVPVANLAVAAKEILVGSFDWVLIAVSWLVTAGVAVWTTRLGVRFLLTEKLITAAETDAAEFAGGPALFEQRVGRWFVVMWAALLIVNNYYGETDLRVQVALNLAGILFGGSCLMIWRYRLDPRAVLALRLPKPAVWLGVSCAVPGGLLAAMGLVEVTNRFLPVSPRLLEGFGESIFPRNIPVVQLLFFLTVMPGIFEEIAFRGVLLHGLRRRLHPVALTLVVGAVFGLYHVALFRLLPTAFLGVLFAAVTLLTGSIFPAMLWHCLSNATSLLANMLQLPESGLEPICYLAGVGLLATAFWIFWRARTPYPGLRSWKGY